MALGRRYYKADPNGGETDTYLEHPHHPMFARFPRQTFHKMEEKIMLWTIFIILLVLWALGFGFAGPALGSLVHILIVLAVIVLILQLVRGRGV